jgi:hypothetical protein
LVLKKNLMKAGWFLVAKVKQERKILKYIK